ncbi:hypothetical protein Bca4012_016077 [Brassica carinata]|uniref:Uncharacterized protein n=1 Tax=Brassica carinata TaxID=52824 RepID=A0A8X7WU83_BRACI|nr:hypothetical protein Bca52824_006008 [Brassica carinata]
MDILVNWENHITTGVVDHVHVFQYCDTCWAFGLTRQMNAIFRLALLISGIESLSVVHFIQSMRRMLLLSHTLTISGLPTAVPFLTVNGLILVGDFNSMCDRRTGLPLLSAPRFPSFVVSEMKIHRLREYKNHHEFEAAFFLALNYSPVAAVIPCYPSLDAFRSQQYVPHDYGLYSPPLQELVSLYTKSHLIFATGRGRMLDIPFVRFRDSAHGAFLNVRMGWGIITEFVQLIGPRVVW